MPRLICAALVTFLALLPHWAAAQAPKPFFAETGVTVSSGDFGTGEDTTIVSVPFTLGYRTERWEVSAT
ncbi:MAG: hypothetical protein HY510_02145, partial [Acidobacteria bacterium]|nr:hypothetical protein [Acidobacteriota bacterium]